MVASPIQFSKINNVGSITLNRPEARNALTPEMVRDLGSAVKSCRSKDIRSVLITGSGDAFCAGADVKGFVEQLEKCGPEELSQHIQEIGGSIAHRGDTWPAPPGKTRGSSHQRCRCRRRLQLDAGL